MRWRVLLGAIGVVVMAYGGVLVLTAGTAVPVPGLALWLVGLDVVSDGILLPVVALLGWLLARGLPDRVRPPVQGGLLVAGVLGIVAFPVLVGAGRREDNPTLLPLHYARGLTVALTVVAVVTVVAVGVRVRRARQAVNDRNERPSTDDDSSSP